MNTMKRAVCAVLLTGSACAAYAQTAPQPLTRAQVRQELAELQAVGYRTSLASSPDFPQDMQAIMQRAAQARGNDSGYGGNGRAAVESGKPALPPAIDRDTYAHH
ncbi:DUF4148 domain-containing protein [Burkholderia pseudomultivorans]|uniref:Purine nucleoside phosphorylase n=1 Tax=Burkholderia pseudomultivorans TaxID=1207504 RepID=A0A6P2Q7F6_9BURK|nr:DUF4148 domain-containing protein [Burkholderia pseudomultivorans]MDR8730765.1 hypothetical protein [Burkholderia pseudomultivorans]MDR8738548.1 hypothetical protein [Burkholderia pseudomultivorans]MDR8744961.1 hypothetical protein [Burkholderia pseudomultivorans]MDR8756847.1 hypothetical protein [Burkholderia pseudomultivorans]MDR8781420.1 hypothetical protein [Burkholderia pseudomultivorans]